MAIQTKIKRWGNSAVVLIPKKVMKEKEIDFGQDVLVDLEKAENPLVELFGSIKFEEPTEKILKELREEWESKWLK